MRLLQVFVCPNLNAVIPFIFAVAPSGRLNRNFFIFLLQDLPHFEGICHLLKCSYLDGKIAVLEIGHSLSLPDGFTFQLCLFGHLHRLNPDTVETRLLGRLVEDRRKAVNLRTTHLQALGANLKEYYPQALELTNDNLSSRLACDLLIKWPTFEDFQQAKPSTLKRFYYGHNVRSPEVIERVLTLAQKSQALTTDPAIVESGRRLTQMYARLIEQLNPVIKDYEQRIQRVFDAHPEVKIFTGLPGAGPVMAPRLLAFFGTDRSRYAAALNVQSFTGIAPVTKSSGKSRVVYARAACPKFDRQTFHEFSRLSVTNCQWARNYVQYYTAKGKKYHTIIRALAYKWIRILHKCWKERTPYNEDKYMETLKLRGSIFATLHLQNKS